MTMEKVRKNGTSGNKPSSKFFSIYNYFLPINRDLLLRFHDPFILEKHKKWHMCVCVCACAHTMSIIWVRRLNILAKYTCHGNTITMTRQTTGKCTRV